MKWIDIDRYRPAHEETCLILIVDCDGRHINLADWNKRGDCFTIRDPETGYDVAQYNVIAWCYHPNINWRPKHEED